MTAIRATIYLKSGSGAKPYRTCYFSEQEYERILKDYEQYQFEGQPQSGLYTEDVSSDDEQQVLIEFAAIAEIRTNQPR
jgi:hypothetical protein